MEYDGDFLGEFLESELRVLDDEYVDLEVVRPSAVDTSPNEDSIKVIIPESGDSYGGTFSFDFDVPACPNTRSADGNHNLRNNGGTIARYSEGRVWFRFHLSWFNDLNGDHKREVFDQIIARGISNAYEGYIAHRKEKEAFIKKQSDFLDNRINKLSDKVDKTRRKATDLEERLRKRRRQMQNLLKEKEILESSSGIDKKAKREFGDLKSINTYEEVMFTMSGEIIGVTESVELEEKEFGQFVVKIVDEEITIHEYDDNIYSGDYYHPHVRHDGYVCLGNIASSVSEMLARRDYSDLLEFMWLFLNRYAPDNSPYSNIEDFQ